MSTQVRIWEIASDFSSSTLLRSFKYPHGFVLSMDCDSTGTLVAMGSSTGKLLVLDIDGGFVTHNLRGHTGLVTPVRFHPSKPAVAAASADNNIWLWDLNDNSHTVFANHMGTITDVVFTPKGTKLISAGRDNIITVFDVASLVPLITIPTIKTIDSLLLLPAETFSVEAIRAVKGFVVLGAGEAGRLAAWDPETGVPVWSEATDELKSLRFTNIFHATKSEQLVVVNEEQELLVYDRANLALRNRVIGNRGDVIDLVPLHSPAAAAAATTDAGAAPGAIPATAATIAVMTNSERFELLQLPSLNAVSVRGHGDVVLSAAASCDGRLLATASKDHTVRLWNVTDPFGHKDESSAVPCVGICEGHAESVTGVAFGWRTPSLLASVGSDTMLKLWDIHIDEETGKATPKARGTTKAHNKDINSVSVAPNDKLIATASQDKTVKIWSVETLNLTGTLLGHKRGVWSAQFSPVDQVVLTASGDGTVRIWSVTTFTCLKMLEGHGNSVLKAVFVSRGMQILSAGADGLVKLWTVKTSECVGTFDKHTDKVWALAALNDGDGAITGGADSVINVWEDTTEQQAIRKKEEEDQRIIKEQQLQNLLANGHHEKALQIALELNHRQHAYEIVQHLLATSPEPYPAPSAAWRLVSSLSDENAARLLCFARDWNAAARKCAAAQAVAAAALRHYDVERLKQIMGAGLPKLVEAFLPYTERHCKQLERLTQSAAFIDYTLGCMGVSLPEAQPATVLAAKPSLEDAE
eukprot:TRINITY_DN6711_c0_g1_i1.p1 TRINITY_DN6711_c0_g1~~TRINITY_DN6711_c0_g1_i1.p1  ORF type:complete len:846 (-),score=238.34 TRINITY_DN6711_c0_g1_i1:24-2285(-)